VHRAPSVFRAGRDHAHHFKRAAVGCDEGNASDRQRQRPPGFEELFAGFIAAAQAKSDQQNEREICADDGVIERVQMKC
jgi:hypothetical protein